MFKLPALTLLAGLSLALPAQAQFAIPASAVTLNYSMNNGCSLSPGQIYSIGTDQLVVGLTNTGTNWISFSVQVALSGTGFSRTIQSAATGALGPGSLVVPIRGLTPALPASITNGSATVTIQTCSTAPTPGGPPRNWR
ncbi:hypothetical protein KTR66_03810 [Roseococcus sp. SDR]|uniref:hypothetical protein n=1 Tax=Roseococcus sp. SDR TaxID=2835532 RepID=UPI001BCEC3E4|nr:hypothetical protein [Roseococcus sp. SDR]MBS7789105.1 hypothetical protein [Roseococcus sp. SDR]MBV1844419.1 hypothetical protein [Roseococcus sp. SDR]